jgi:LysR family glycine cleavage system transcriptional activator
MQGHPVKRPRLNVLRTFEAAGRRLNFSTAAKDLNISQAAVSQQIRQLEKYLNTELFVRHHRQLFLTGTGSAYLEAVHEALDRLDTVTDQLFPGRQSQSVTLHCTASVAALWLAPQLGAFRKLHPNIDLRIRTLGRACVGDGPDSADLEIFVQRAGATHPHATKLFTSTITPVCAPALIAKTGPLAAPADILEHQLIHVTGYDDDWHRWLRAHHLRDIAVPRGLLVDGSLIAIEAAVRGDGIMLGRRPFIDHLLASGELIEPFAKTYHLHADYYLRQSAETRALRPSKTVAAWLGELAALHQTG